MSKLYFRYGVMNSGKSLFLLSTAHNFKERGVKYLILKPCIDTRDKMVKSRALNQEVDCILITETENVINKLSELLEKEKPQWLLVDESQFLSPQQIDQLAYIVDNYNINVICYGLRTDFKTNLFPGSKRLFEIADSFEEMKSTCSCGNKASVNARIDEQGHIVIDGEQIECGGEDKYVTLCRKCFYKFLKK